MKARLKEFIIKLLSLKTVVFIIATVIFWTTDKLPWWGWLTACGMFLGLRYMEKLQGLGAWNK